MESSFPNSVRYNVKTKVMVKFKQSGQHTDQCLNYMKNQRIAIYTSDLQTE